MFERSLLKLNKLRESLWYICSGARSFQQFGYILDLLNQLFLVLEIFTIYLQSAVVGTLAVGITIVLIIGDIDLSVAATSRVWCLYSIVNKSWYFSPLACLIIF